MLLLWIAAAQAGSLGSLGTVQRFAPHPGSFVAVGPAAGRPAAARVSRGGPAPYATYVLRHPILVGTISNIAIVTTGTLNARAPYRLDSATGLRTMSERTAGVEWLHAGDWSMTVGYASTKPPRTASRLGPAFGTGANDVRVAKGLRVAAELLSSDGTTARQSLGLDARLQRVRIPDTSLTQAGERVGEARLALVFKRSW